MSLDVSDALCNILVWKIYSILQKYGVLGAGILPPVGPLECNRLRIRNGWAAFYRKLRVSTAPLAETHRHNAGV